MSVHDDGGPAYPVVELDRVTGHPWDQHMGMTMRDWFAGQFLSTYVTESDICIEYVAKYCYRMADAMLAERAKR